MKLYVVVLIMFAILTLSAICNAGKDREKKEDADTKSTPQAIYDDKNDEYTDNKYWDSTHHTDDRLKQPQHPKADSLNAFQTALTEKPQQSMPPTNPPNQQATTASVGNSAQNPINVSDSEESYSWLYAGAGSSSDSSTKSRPKGRKKN